MTTVREAQQSHMALQRNGELGAIINLPPLFIVLFFFFWNSNTFTKFKNQNYVKKYAVKKNLPHLTHSPCPFSLQANS